MRLPRKGVWIRVLIYGSLFGYFGWGAIMRCRAQSAQEEARPSSEDVLKKLDGQKKSITLPDGTQRDIYEITPEQAEQYFGIEAKKPDEKADDEPDDGPEPEDPKPPPAGAKIPPAE